MAHNIEEYDIVQSKRKTWHGLEKREENIKISADGNACLNRFEVEPVKTWIGKDRENLIEAPEFKLGFSDMRGGEGNAPVYMDSKAYDPTTYTLFNNRAFLGFIEKSLEGIEHTIETCGSVRGRKRIFVSASLTSDQKNHNESQGAGRTFKNFFNFGSSHDASSQLWFNNSNVCTVCDNTFSYNLAEILSLLDDDKRKEFDGLAFAISHTKNMMDRIENMPLMVQAFIKGNEIFAERIESFADVSLSDEQAGHLFLSFLTPKTFKEPTKRGINRTNEMVQLFRNGKGNNGENLADAFSAATDFFTHRSAANSLKLEAGRKEALVKQYVSSEHSETKGSANFEKQRFFTLANDGKAVKTNIRRGKSLQKAAINIAV